MREFRCREFADYFAELTGLSPVLCYKITHQEVYLNSISSEGGHRSVTLKQRGEVVLILMGINHKYNLAQHEENRMMIGEFLRRVDAAGLSPVGDEHYQFGHDNDSTTKRIRKSFLARVLNG